MRMQDPGRVMRALAVAALTALFLLLALGLTILSSGVYRSAAAASQEHAVQRTALSYVVNQLRRADCGGAAALIAFGDGDALRLDDGSGYVTVLYCSDGSLMELYADANLDAAPADGETLMALDALRFAVGEDGLLTVTAVSGDAEYSVCVRLRTMEVDA